MELLFLTIHTDGLVGLKSIKKRPFFVMKLKEYSYLDILYVFLYINILKVIFSIFQNTWQRPINNKQTVCLRVFQITSRVSFWDLKRCANVRFLNQIIRGTTIHKVKSNLFNSKILKIPFDFLKANKYFFLLFFSFFPLHIFIQEEMKTELTNGFLRN